MRVKSSVKIRLIEWMLNKQYRDAHRVATSMYCCDGKLWRRPQRVRRQRRTATAVSRTAVHCWAVHCSLNSTDYVSSGVHTEDVVTVARRLQATVRCRAVTRSLNNTYRHLPLWIPHSGCCRPSPTLVVWVTWTVRFRPYHYSHRRVRRGVYQSVQYKDRGLLGEIHLTKSN